MVPKRKFEFEPFSGLADIYIDGQKVHAGHLGDTGHIYFHLSPKEPDYEVEAAPYDPRIGIEVEIKGGEVVPFEIQRPVKKPAPFVRPEPKADKPVVRKPGPQPSAIEPKSIEDYATPKEV